MPHLLFVTTCAVVYCGNDNTHTAQTNENECSIHPSTHYTSQTDRALMYEHTNARTEPMNTTRAYISRARHTHNTHTHTHTHTPHRTHNTHHTLYEPMLVRPLPLNNCVPRPLAEVIWYLLLLCVFPFSPSIVWREERKRNNSD